MIRKISLITTTLMAAIFTQSVWASDDFTVSKKKSPILGDVTDISITAKVDKVKITDISVNRGNCRIINSYGNPVEKPIKPFSLNFGDTIKFGAAGFCNPLEVEIKTDKGTFRTGWDK